MRRLYICTACAFFMPPYHWTELATGGRSLYSHRDMRASRLFTNDAANLLKAAIDEAEGNEVCALGFLADGELIEEIRVVSRGNEHAALALFEDSGRSAWLIHNHPSGVLTPSDNDLAIAARLADQGLGACIVDNSLSRVYVIVEARRLSPGGLLDCESLKALLSSGGKLARAMGQFEDRHSQLELLENVSNAFNTDGILVAEAGTGVGKSFAYLIPALEWARLNDERIVVSTATINLQHQLYEKDIPFLCKNLKSDVKVVLVKGRSNYLCRRRLSDALVEKDLFSDDTEGLDDLPAWADSSASGSRSDLPWVPPEGLWSRVCSESDTCLGMRCSYRDTCFMLKIKREAAAARLLVVNHHLLFADLAARSKGAGFEQAAVLPAWDRLVIDEAHNIEDAATSFFSEYFGKLMLFRHMSRLLRRRGGAPSGILVQLARAVGSDGFIADMEESLHKIRSSLEELDERALYCLEHESSIRLAAPRYRDVAGMLLPAFTELRLHISRLAGLARQLFDILEENEVDDPAVWEAKALVRRIEGAGAVCNSFLEYEERPDRILWLERRRTSRGEPWVLYYDSPLEVSHALRESLFEPCRTVVCVSATLTVGGTFEHWLHRSGALHADRSPLSTGIFPSPFDYAKRSVLVAVQGAPAPDMPNYPDFLVQSIYRLILASGGSALVLFTSFDSLRRSWEKLCPLLEEEGIPVYRQGDDDRVRLLARFKEEPSSVLFGTDSFWEGVDAPGDTLRLVIICKLPFKSPSDPIFEARSEDLERKGGNAFFQLSLPEAVMKFRQGFGRLMRGASDHGVVAVLDARVLTKRYGQTFVNSLPPCTKVQGLLDEVIEDIHPFFSMK